MPTGGEVGRVCSVYAPAARLQGVREQTSGPEVGQKIPGSQEIPVNTAAARIAFRWISFEEDKK